MEQLFHYVETVVSLCRNVCFFMMKQYRKYIRGTIKMNSPLLLYVQR